MFEEDFSDFINPDTPGYKVMIIDGQNVEGIFDEHYVESGFSESTAPVLHVATSKIPGVSQGSSVLEEMGTRQFEVVNLQPDGTGITLLKLKLI